MRLKKHGTPQLRQDGKHGGVEALEVPGLQDALVLYGQIEQFISLSERGGYRLFDEQIEPGLKQHGRNRVVIHGGNGDRRRVEAEIRREKFFNRGEYGDGVV